MKQQLDMLVNDPNLVTDLKQLKRETRNVSIEVQEDLTWTFYRVDIVNAFIGDEYLIIKRQDAQRKQVRKIVHDKDGTHLVDQNNSRDLLAAYHRHQGSGSSNANSLTDKVEHIIEKNHDGIVGAIKKSQMDAYYRAIQANQTLVHARKPDSESSFKTHENQSQVFLKGHPYSNYHPLPDASLLNLHNKQNNGNKMPVADSNKRL